jgi:hypothetical protein
MMLAISGETAIFLAIDGNTAIYLAISLVLSTISAVIAKQRQKRAQAVDDRAQTLASRGEQLPILIGVHQVGALFAWVGDRRTLGTDLVESGWHQVATGPVNELLRIWDGGQVVWEGRITSNQRASGSVIQTKNGAIWWYWGEESQPKDTYLTTQIGLSSRFPFYCGGIWREKNLGPVATWTPTLWEIACYPVASPLTCLAWRFDEFVDGPDAAGGAGVITNVQTGVGGWIEVWDARAGRAGFRMDEYKDGYDATVEGQSGFANLKYTILFVEHFPAASATHPIHGLIFGMTRLHMNTEVSSFTVPNLGNVRWSTLTRKAGANPAHMLYQLMFTEWPHGASRSTEFYDIDSLDAIGAVLESEGMFGRIIVQGHAAIDEAISQIMLECGIFLSYDPLRGRNVFNLARSPDVAHLPRITADMILSPQPNALVTHDAPEKADRLSYTFLDRTIEYRERPVSVTSDGTSDGLTGEARHEKTVQLVIPSLEIDARKVAERRSQEELAQQSAARVRAVRGVRLLRPGREIAVHDMAHVQRVMAVQPETLTSACEVQVLADFYGLEAPLEAQLPQGADDSGAPPVLVPDPMLRVFEDGDGVAFLRVRGSKAAFYADFLVAVGSGSEEVAVARSPAYAIGGVLTSGLAAGTAAYVDVGPTFDAVGVDADEAIDLTGDDDGWFAGEQRALLGGEMVYVQRIESLGGGSFRLRGLLRARRQTVQEGHAVGDEVYVFRPNIARLPKSVDIGRTITVRTRVVVQGADPSGSASLEHVITAPTWADTDWSEDFVGAIEDMVLSGALTTEPGDAVHRGVVRLDTSSCLSARAIGLSPRSPRLSFSASVAPVNGTGTLVVGLTDMTLASTPGAGLWFERDSGSGTWHAKWKGPLGTLTEATGIASDAGTWYDLRIEVRETIVASAIAWIAVFAIDGNVVATLAEKTVEGTRVHATLAATGGAERLDVDRVAVEASAR